MVLICQEIQAPKKQKLSKINAIVKKEKYIWRDSLCLNLKETTCKSEDKCKVIGTEGYYLSSMKEKNKNFTLSYHLKTRICFVFISPYNCKLLKA